MNDQDRAEVENIVDERTSQFNDLEQKIRKLLTALNHKGVFTEEEILEIEA